jgi:hypothetical protein
MALTTTSLAAPITANDLAFIATSATGATVGGFVRIDDEFMAVTAIAGTLISVRSRGDYGSQAVAHQGLSSVVFGLASDLAPLGTSETIPVPAAFDMATIGVNGAIPVPTRHTVYFLTKATALAATSPRSPPRGCLPRRTPFHRLDASPAIHVSILLDLETSCPLFVVPAHPLPVSPRRPVC